MQHVHDIGKSDRVGSAVRFAIEVVHDFHDASAAESLERLGEGRLGSKRNIENRTVAAIDVTLLDGRTLLRLTTIIVKAPESGR